MDLSHNYMVLNVWNSHQRCSVIKAFLENFAVFTGKQILQA